MAAVAFACCLPILYWNAQNDWVTFRHVAGQAGVPTANRNLGIRYLGPLEFVGLQFALLLGYWFVAWFCAMIQFRPWRQANPSIRYLWWTSATTFIVFALSSLKSAGQVNWPVAAYLSGSVLMTAWLMKAADSISYSYRRLTRVGISIACTLGVLLTIITCKTELARPALVAAAKIIKKNDPFSIRTVDPTCRLRGWKHLCREIDVVRRAVVDEDGIEPLIAGSAWSTPGELGFYCQGHPQAFSLGPYFGDRHSQYDHWHPNPVADAQVFRGKTFVVVSDHEPTLKEAFVQVKSAKVVMYREDDVLVAAWTIWICRDFRGIKMNHPPGTY